MVEPQAKVERPPVAHPAILDEGRELVGHRVLPAGGIEQHFERGALEEVELMVAGERGFDRRFEPAEVEPNFRSCRPPRSRRLSSWRRTPADWPCRKERRSDGGAPEKALVEVSRRGGVSGSTPRRRRAERALQVVALEAHEQARGGHPVVPAVR